MIYCIVIFKCGGFEGGVISYVRSSRGALRASFFRARHILRAGVLLIGCAAVPLSAKAPPEGVGNGDTPSLTGTTLAGTGTVKALFERWRQLDRPADGFVSIPSIHPVAATTLRFSSYFGIRTDPFTGRAAMHEGVDIPGAVGTPVYATGSGVVERAGRAGGYGNLVEINHGGGVETRYGHLSQVFVSPQQRVERGQEIGLMGSTGRSTGSHLHYEVRIAGHAVDPMPFLQSTGLPPVPHDSFGSGSLVVAQASQTPAG